MSEELKQMQEDEREALVSIYEGDDAFKQSNPTTYQYKYGTEEDEHTFLVELVWGEEYPNVLPDINLNMFYNQHIVEAVKQKIIETLNAEAEQWIGCGMTYTLFECLKDRIAEMMEDQPQATADDETSSEESDDSDSSDADIGNLSLSGAKGGRKDKLTKAQKRRQWDHAIAGGDRPKGWDWVDIVKHLSQCGKGDEAGSIPQNHY